MTKHLGYYIKPKAPKVEAPKKTKRKAKKVNAPVVIETEQQEMEQQIES